ncbi:MAG: hypothetical protein NXI24_16795 [bacterium]|nr:hypothetical protein [bacterium]
MLPTHLRIVLLSFRLLLPVLLAGLLLCLPAIGATALYADGVTANESQLSSAETEEAIQAFLTKFDPERFNREEETDGFDFLFNSSLFSAFDYQIYGGRISARIDQSIVRVEGDTGDVETLTRILELENILKPGSTAPPRGEAVPLDYKSHWIGQGLNFLAPWLGVFYNSYASPRLSFGQTWLRAGLYFLADGLMVAAGGTKFFSEGFDSSENGGLIAGMLVLPRIVGAVQTANLNRGHNRLVEFKYTFYFD